MVLFVPCFVGQARKRYSYGKKEVQLRGRCTPNTRSSVGEGKSCQFGVQQQYIGDPGWVV